LDPRARTSTLDLLERARAGDAGALNELIARYLPRMRRWASGRLPGSARTLLDTDDLVQDALVGAVRRLPQADIHGEGLLQAYLRQTLTNRIRDLYRQQARRPVQLPMDSGLADPDASPLEKAIGSEALARYEGALLRLSDMDRTAVILRIELRCGYEEIAAALPKNGAAQARVAVSRALARLSREMTRA